MDVDSHKGGMMRIKTNQLQWSHVLMDVDRALTAAVSVARLTGFNGATS